MLPMQEVVSEEKQEIIHQKHGLQVVQELQLRHQRVHQKNGLLEQVGLMILVQVVILQRNTPQGLQLQRDQQRNGLQMQVVQRQLQVQDILQKRMHRIQGMTSGHQRIGQFQQLKYPPQITLLSNMQQVLPQMVLQKSGPQQLAQQQIQLIPLKNTLKGQSQRQGVHLRTGRSQPQLQLLQPQMPLQRSGQLEHQLIRMTVQLNRGLQ